MKVDNRYALEIDVVVRARTQDDFNPHGKPGHELIRMPGFYVDKAGRENLAKLIRDFAIGAVSDAEPSS